VYLEPSYIDRLTVQLHDDKGNLVNLNDVNWSFSLIFEERLN
jgi:murein L,D-transpeptidase YcbB/YkuD